MPLNGKRGSATNRLIAVVAIAGLLASILLGFFWWGMPTQRTQTELGEARKRAEMLEMQGEGSNPDPRAAGAARGIGALNSG